MNNEVNQSPSCGQCSLAPYKHTVSQTNQMADRQTASQNHSSLMNQSRLSKDYSQPNDGFPFPELGLLMKPAK